VRHLDCLSRTISSPTRLSGASDLWLANELDRLGKQWDESRADPEDEGHGGSPGEWLWESMGEIETEQKRRAALVKKKKARVPAGEAK